MRCILLLPAVLLLGPLACEEMPGQPTDAVEAGVQVGSEGILVSGCDTQPVDPDATIASLGFSAATVGGRLEAVDVVELRPDGPVGSLTLQPGEWSVVERCTPSLVAPVRATLELGDALSADLSGWASVGSDTVVQLAFAAGEFTGQREPEGLEDDAVVRLLLDGTIDGAFSGELAFEGCVGDECALDALGTVQGR